MFMRTLYDSTAAFLKRAHGRRQVGPGHLLSIFLLGSFCAVPPLFAGKQTVLETSLVPRPDPKALFLWDTPPPPDCPFPRSKELVEIGFTGRHAEYTWADTWYPSWGADNRMYSCFTDGSVGNVRVGSGSGARAAVGHAIIVGDDPLRLRVIEPGKIPGSALPYLGRYPSASLYYKGVWYIGTYCLAPAGRVVRDGKIYNWPWLGPFVGFHISTNKGKEWIPCPHTPARPLFGESGLHGEPVKFGAVHVVDFGQELQYSPDGKVYLVSHGASVGPKGRRFGYNSWITGDEIYLCRVPPGPEHLNNAADYEFFAGHDSSGAPIWSRRVEEANPIARWMDHMGCVTITYNAPLKKYLMCVTDGGDTTSFYNTYILEADRITGPYRLVKYLRHFGEQAYFVNIPSKFISKDGRTLWLCYAANFAASWKEPRLLSVPRGSRYGMCLQQIRLFRPNESIPRSPLLTLTNLARMADITVSSVHPGYDVEGLVDGVVSGYPKQIRSEWASRREKTGAFVRLHWARSVRVRSVLLFDRPNLLDQVQAGVLLFSDGSSLSIGALPDDASKGLLIKFPEKRVDWLAFFVTKVKPGTQNIGLSELAVFGSAEP